MLDPSINLQIRVFCQSIRIIILKKAKSNNFEFISKFLGNIKKIKSKSVSKIFTSKVCKKMLTK